MQLRSRLYNDDVKNTQSGPRREDKRIIITDGYSLLLKSLRRLFFWQVGFGGGDATLEKKFMPALTT